MRVPRQSLSLLVAATLALSGTLSVAACRGPAAVPAVTPAADGSVKLVLKMPRELLANGGNTYTRDDIDHVILDLVLVDDAGVETHVANTDIQEFELAEDVVFNHLNGNRHYRVRARAYAAPGTAAADLISVQDERSWTDIETTDEQVVTVNALKVKLRAVAPLVAKLVAGDGVGTDVQNVEDMDFDGAGDLYFTEYNRHVVWRVPADGSPRTVYAGQLDQWGNTPGTDRLSAQLNFPSAVEADTNGNVFVADRENGRSYVRWIHPTGPVETLPVETPVASDGFDNLRDLALLSDRSLLVADSAARQIYRYPFNGTGYDPAVVFAGTGVSGDDDGAATSAATFDTPDELSVGADGTVFVRDRVPFMQEGSGNTIRTIRNGEVKTLGGGEGGFGEIKSLTVGPYGHLFFFGSEFGDVELRRHARNGNTRTFDVRLHADGSMAGLYWAKKLVAGPNRSLYAAISSSTNGYRIWKIQ